MVWDGIMVVAATIRLWLQKFGGHVQVNSKSSPESYNITLQEALYKWSKEEITTFL